ncbi:elongation of very long chain fatty acids protein AAEL008004-like [Ceratina calcarata]|uniref:Elongation of very long chain fatty acids protein n=1 Tax=Ceratina calcarata TaxID=156304 RepID=A0AAJ7JD50_9HYME|nr:elongation of very long chain fatty acids protein AAEL008004-like [Ceratina calcarata]
MSLVRYYHYLNTELSDPRTRDWVLVSSPVPVVLLTFAYLYFVLKCGPRYMKNRPAYKLFTFIRIFNIFQIIANACLMYSLIDVGLHEDNFVTCSSHYLHTPEGYKLCHIGWYTLIVKLSDYIETPVFVLRQKQRQISFLHLYHHVTTMILSWIYVKYFPNETTITPLLLNCSVHVIMYTYYLLTSYGPSMQKRLKMIKPMITTIQLVQFVIIIFLSLRVIFVPKCTGAKVYASILLIDVIVNFVLFSNFFKQNYLKNNKLE